MNLALRFLLPCRQFFVPSTFARPSSAAPQQYNNSARSQSSPILHYTRQLSTQRTMEGRKVVHQDKGEVAQLVTTLEAARLENKGVKKKTFKCRKTRFMVGKGGNVAVDSWKFMDWDYKRDDLPTYARGLFTTKRQDGTPEIATRGYDKFFNINEVNSTQWRNIENNTRGPYELSVKENGCIIFISGLEDGSLLVCSKHSTGARSDTDRSHAQVGEEWIERHVASVGKTTAQLAKELREMNATAVGELCDDSFEEHVLAYDQNSAGIYLHGINFNVPEFATLSSPEVHKFADAWGFKKANFVVYDDLDSVKRFLERCAETGSWDGRETEGFVIRCHMSEGGRGPLRDWFFKYKFEEPYLMYRQWRECTKSMLSGKQPRIKKHKKITEEYLVYARRQFALNPELKVPYQHNHGIIAMRDGFLAERGLNGAQIIQMEADNVTRDVVLVPIASIGCGKTTVALALVKLFGWGHIQNDNIPKQKSKPKAFAAGVLNQLLDKPVVIADRNNHQKRERDQIIKDVTAGTPNARFVALHYVHEPKDMMLPEIREVTRKRVLERGDNHQTIRAGTKDSGEVIGIMEGFLNRFEAVDVDHEPDMSFDEVIDLDVTASSRENLEKVVNALHSAYPQLVKKVPSAQELDDAINHAVSEYNVDVDHSGSYKQVKGPKQNNKAGSPNSGINIEAKVRNIEYFGITLPTKEVSDLLHSLFTSETPPERARLYHQLVKSRRVQPAFHVTLIHKASKKDHAEVWDSLTQLYTEKMLQVPPKDHSVTPTLGSARIRLERLIWDGRLMTFVARIMPQDENDQPDWMCVNPLPHVTVGTASPQIKPKESNDLLQRWLKEGSGEGTGIWEAEIPGVKVVNGTVSVVMSRGR
ncbi:Putative tRNA ligase (Eurofung) [Aspergillus calidoustus]|uniref:tRNA ligase n=1 Tax=Aspergillus calidoustus TaxID=454130 RepID=A0A0U5GTN4_ASPCI|nr:Putative tRNA ligase (Eurofung) [Aspergillus calidoustus]